MISDTGQTSPNKRHTHISSGRRENGLSYRRHWAGCFCYVTLKATSVFYYTVVGGGFALSKDEAGVVL